MAKHTMRETHQRTRGAAGVVCGTAWWGESCGSDVEIYRGTHADYRDRKCTAGLGTSDC